MLEKIKKNGFISSELPIVIMIIGVLVYMTFKKLSLDGFIRWEGSILLPFVLSLLLSLGIYNNVSDDEKYEVSDKNKIKYIGILMILNLLTYIGLNEYINFKTEINYVLIYGCSMIGLTSILSFHFFSNRGYVKKRIERGKKYLFLD